MNRVRLVLSVIVPSLVVGGFLFGSGLGHADAGRDGSLGDWPATSDHATGVRVAQADPWGNGRPAGPPAPPAPPDAPVPYGRHTRNRGMAVKIRDGKLEIDGIQELVQEQLLRVDDILDNIPDLPVAERMRIKARVRAVRGKLRSQLGRLKSIDLDQIGPELERMGDEIEREMEGLDKDLAPFGDQFGKSFEKFGKDLAKDLTKNLSIPAIPAIPGVPAAPAVPSRVVPSRRDADHSDEADSDGDDGDERGAAPMPPGADVDASADPADMRAAIADLKGLTLDQEQKAKLVQLRATADQQIAQAKRDLDEMSTQLHASLGDLNASEAEIASQIDKISEKEAMIRKARILAWVRVRSLLTKDQRKLVESAAAKKPH